MTGMLHQDTALFICLFGRNPNHRRRHQSDAITNKQSIHQMERETILKERPRYCLMDQDSCQQSIDLFMWNIKDTSRSHSPSTVNRSITRVVRQHQQQQNNIPNQLLVLQAPKDNWFLGKMDMMIWTAMMMMMIVGLDIMLTIFIEYFLTICLVFVSFYFLNHALLFIFITIMHYTSTDSSSKREYSQDDCEKLANLLMYTKDLPAVCHKYPHALKQVQSKEAAMNNPLHGTSKKNVNAAKLQRRMTTTGRRFSKQT